MALLIKHFGKIVKGRKVYNNPELYANQLAQLEGMEFEEIIKKRTRKTTLSQFAFYYGAILPTCYQCEIFSAFDKSDDVGIYFEDKFLSYTIPIHLPNGGIKTITKTKSLTGLNIDETSEFITKVLAECDSLGITVLSPEEYFNRYYK